MVEIILSILIFIALIYIFIIRKIIKKHKENVILNNEYRKAKKEQKKNRK